MLVEIDTNRAEGDTGAFLISLNPIVYPTRVVLPRSTTRRNGNIDRLTPPHQHSRNLRSCFSL